MSDKKKKRHKAWKKSPAGAMTLAAQKINRMKKEIKEKDEALALCAHALTIGAEGTQMWCDAQNEARDKLQELGLFDDDGDNDNV